MKRGLVASTQQVPSEPVPKSESGLVEKQQQVPDELVPKRKADDQGSRKQREKKTVKDTQQDKKQDGPTVK